ncbi:MAG: FAD/NAD(P)-binding oxidoreductase [Pseudomonadota bacterium]
MSQRCVVIGGGHAGAQVGQSLRNEGWSGTITVITDEAYLPYHRPPLSKAFLKGESSTDELLIRPASTFEKMDVEFKLNASVASIDPALKQLELIDGTSHGYDRLVISTGSRPREISLPGIDLAGVCYLRTINDVQRIKRYVSPGGSAVIVGGGYIGLETAAVLTKLGMQVTVLEVMDRVLQRVTCEEMSEFFTRVHTEEGVNVRTNVSATSFEGAKKVEAVLGSDGSSIAADLVIIGAGILPNVELAEAAGLLVENGIVVDEFGRTSDASVFAAGDCTNHPNALLGKRLRLESVPNAVEQAKTVAASICGKEKPYAAHPWFWSDQYDIKLQIAGFNQGYDQVVVRGDHTEGRSFVAYYLREGQLIAADCVNRPREFVAAKQILARRIQVSSDRLTDETIEPKALLG